MHMAFISVLSFQNTGASEIHYKILPNFNIFVKSETSLKSRTPCPRKRDYKEILNFSPADYASLYSKDF